MNRATSLAMLWVAAALGPVSTAYGQTVAPQPLAPNSRWNVDYADNYCVLQRAFGSAQDPLLLRVSQYAPDGALEFMLIGTPLKPFAVSATVTLELAGGADRTIRPIVARAKDGTASILFSSTLTRDDSASRQFAQGSPPPKSRSPAPDLAFETALDTIGLHDGKNNRITLDTGSMAAPLAALRRCMGNLLVDWGLDPVVQAGLTRRPYPKDSTAITRSLTGKYPSSAVLKGQQARVNYIALIDASGKVTHCRTAQSYGNSKAFDELACKAVSGAAFEPALDAAGNPVASYYTATAMWLTKG